MDFIYRALFNLLSITKVLYIVNHIHRFTPIYHLIYPLRAFWDSVSIWRTHRHVNRQRWQSYSGCLSGVNPSGFCLGSVSLQSLGRISNGHLSFSDPSFDDAAPSGPFLQRTARSDPSVTCPLICGTVYPWVIYSSRVHPFDVRFSVVQFLVSFGGPSIRGLSLKSSFWLSISQGSLHQWSTSKLSVICLIVCSDTFLVLLVLCGGPGGPQSPPTDPITWWLFVPSQAKLIWELGSWKGFERIALHLLCPRRRSTCFACHSATTESLSSLIEPHAIKPPKSTKLRDCECCGQNSIWCALFVDCARLVAESTLQGAYQAETEQSPHPSSIH